MVRFSDMLGGSEEADDAAADSPYAALASDSAESDDDAEPETGTDDTDDAFREPVPVATFETPEAVLDRLTQYRTSTRAVDPVVPPAPPVEAPAAFEAPAEAIAEPEPETETAEPESEPLPPVGDDFLPNARGIVRRSGRGRKRHP